MILGRILIYLTILMAFLYSIQNSLMFFPERFSYEEAQQLAKQRGLKPWPEDTPSYRGFTTANSVAKRATVIVLHGNAGEASDRTYFVQALEPLGYRVILHEYPGYGAREGKMDEQALVTDACRTVHIAKEQYPGPVFLFGESIGSGIASGVVAQCKFPVQGVALITPWDNLPDIAQHHYWFLPARWLVRDRYDNSENLQGFPGRVAVLYAQKDNIIPPEHAQRLYESLPGEKRLWVFEKAGHNSWPAWPDASWWKEVMQFLDQEQH